MQNKIKLGRLAAICVVILLGISTASAQGFLKRLGDKAKEKLRSKVEDKVDDIVDKGTDAVFNIGKKKKKKEKAETTSDDADTYDSPVQNMAQETDVKNDIRSVKSDFVRGGVIMFEDDMRGEQVGEFPSKWDLERGNAEIAVVNGETCIAMNADDSWITPLVKGGIKNYLGDEFTIEYDMLYKHNDQGGPHFELDIMHETKQRDHELFTVTYNLNYDKTSVSCSYVRPSKSDWSGMDGSSTANDIMRINDGRWHHFALSFNKRAIKFYIDGVRCVNVPNAKAGAGWLTWFIGGGESDMAVYLKNVVIAKGAVELYDRKETDMSAVEKAIAESGKFVTNNILFDTGKATIKVESMAEIQNVADYMKKNPTVRFEVQGHTDNEGSDKINDALSQQRAEAIVKALESMGCDPFNLRAVGKGSYEPVASNDTPEGRSKNRRVEFIKK